MLGMRRILDSIVNPDTSLYKFRLMYFEKLSSSKKRKKRCLQYKFTLFCLKYKFGCVADFNKAHPNHSPLHILIIPEMHSFHYALHCSLHF